MTEFTCSNIYCENEVMEYFDKCEDCLIKENPITEQTKCKVCNQVKELASYKEELMCQSCAKDEMFKDGSVQREIENHG